MIQHKFGFYPFFRRYMCDPLDDPLKVFLWLRKFLKLIKIISFWFFWRPALRTLHAHILSVKGPFPCTFWKRLHCHCSLGLYPIMVVVEPLIVWLVPVALTISIQWQAQFCPADPTHGLDYSVVDCWLFMIIRPYFVRRHPQRNILEH
jgi:hypothetical protein